MRLVVLVSCLTLAACKTAGTASPEPMPERPPTVTGSTHRMIGTDPGGAGAGTALRASDGHVLAAFAGGCFWGVEDMFRQVPGVTATAVGYAGGHTTNPTYESVCTHTTGHAETVLVEFDPQKVSYQKLLDVFFANHDPTTLNRQGPDVGDQYRSAVFTFSDVQAESARTTAAREEARIGKRVTTQIAPMPAFWKAEDYHQQYDEKTGTHSCPTGVPQGI
ncbi:MAG TPA: peptide-methionine (S)-S-oxide reductase MsrA [Labilithrix sp.]|jgi:peptide-methionine (S)-S-oxide reductase